MKKILLIISFLLFTAQAPLFAAQATATWTPSTTPISEFKGYTIEYGEVSTQYIVEIRIPNTFSKYTVGGLEQGKTYYFAMRAYDSSENFSLYSNEVSHTVPVTDTTAPEPPFTIEIPAGSSVNINIGNP